MYVEVKGASWSNQTAIMSASGAFFEKENDFDKVASRGAVFRCRSEATNRAERADLKFEAAAQPLPGKGCESLSLRIANLSTTQEMILSTTPVVAIGKYGPANRIFHLTVA